LPYSDKERKRYFAIKEALTTAEKKLIDYYELQYTLRIHVPTVEEVASYLEIPQTSINYYLNRAPVIKALDKRGIPWRQHSQTELTATQVAVASTMANFTDERSNKEKLDELGINSATYYAWLNDPQFKNLVESLAERNLGNFKPEAVNQLGKKIQGGHWDAIKYYLDATGAVRGNDAPQSEMLLRMIIEIIQKHVKDEATIIAIANDIKLASSNRTLEVATPREITGEVIEDPELEAAKKMLGVN